MLTNASTEGKAEAYTGAGASEQQNASQAYKFFFRLVTVPPTTRPLRLRTIVPSRHLGITNQERADIERARLEAEQAERPGIRFEDLDEPEWVGTDHDYVKHYAKDRFHSGVYTMTTTPEIDEAARKIVALPKVSRAFQGINNNVERLDKNAAHIVNILLGLSDSVRKHFNVDQNDYGKFFEMDDWPIEVVGGSTDIFCRDAERRDAFIHFHRTKRMHLMMTSTERQTSSYRVQSHQRASQRGIQYRSTGRILSPLSKSGQWICMTGWIGLFCGVCSLR
ncbi:hypothetical protein BCV69DRAFT_133553 [Microstroma glucosiphilum]|uniref:Uncharacterized protein n=1 Tax=Pseudomicrostroma glucosiphilum TaxID=1684307 RepID=A0A316UAD1_9BASI|nr:hypothetical protein BCV69DRAFT_133553 [Pseudomicrostroma glucosiphilum]PWN22122.1 hypothetical protein BCV69DRAFT_133553 [Pseudomicrostroma glucosiphilum]